MTSDIRIVLLNGPSSSGKSSIAREMQRLLSEPYLHAAWDRFMGMLPAGFLEHAEPGLRQVTMRRLASGFHHSLAALNLAECRLIVDHILSQPERWQEIVRLLAPEHVLLVGVYCPLDELERREQVRGNRQPGLARSQYERVHIPGIYDLVVDTSQCSPSECAEHILAILSEPPIPSAWSQLRAYWADRQRE